MPKYLHELIQDQLGVNVEVKTSSPSIQNATQKILSNNPNRVALTIVNLGQAAVYIMIDNRVSSERGIRLAGSGGSVSFTWEYDLDLIAYSWFATAPVGVNELLILEALTI